MFVGTASAEAFAQDNFVDRSEKGTLAMDAEPIQKTTNQNAAPPKPVIQSERVLGAEHET